MKMKQTNKLISNKTIVRHNQTGERGVYRKQYLRTMIVGFASGDRHVFPHQVTIER
jgi:hypothetical protein